VARHSTDSARLTGYCFLTLRFIHTGRGGSFPRVESETTPHTAQPKRRHNVAAAIAIMTKSGPCIAAHKHDLDGFKRQGPLDQAKNKEEDKT
jgi:hypothetical protein